MGGGGDRRKGNRKSDIVDRQTNSIETDKQGGAYTRIGKKLFHKKQHVTRMCPKDNRSCIFISLSTVKVVFTGVACCLVASTFGIVVVVAETLLVQWEHQAPSQRSYPRGCRQR
jgi:hypothetical protein